MLDLQSLNLFLRPFGDEAFTMQFPVGPRVRLGAGRHQIGRNLPLGGDISHDFDLFFDLRQASEEFGVGVAYEDIFGDRAASFVGGFQAGGIGVVKEDLCLQDRGRFFRDIRIVGQCQIEQHRHRQAAFHMPQQLEGECWRYLIDVGLAKNNIL